MVLLYKLLYKVLTNIENINKCMEIIFVERKEKIYYLIVSVY